MVHSLSIPKDQMDEFCRRWKVAELAVHRSVQRGERAGEDDMGLFVRFDPTAEWNLTDRIQMERELQALSGKSISIQSRHGEHVRSGRRSMRLLYNA